MIQRLAHSLGHNVLSEDFPTACFGHSGLLRISKGFTATQRDAGNIFAYAYRSSILRSILLAGRCQKSIYEIRCRGVQALVISPSELYDTGDLVVGSASDLGSKKLA